MGGGSSVGGGVDATLSEASKFEMSRTYFDSIKARAQSGACQTFLTNLFGQLSPASGGTYYSNLLTNLGSGPFVGSAPVTLQPNAYYTLGGVIQTNTAATTSLGAGTFPITLWEPFFAMPPADQLISLLHEEVHAATYLATDEKIAELYGWKPDPSKSSDANLNSASVYWNQQLAAACK